MLPGGGKGSGQRGNRKSEERESSRLLDDSLLKLQERVLVAGRQLDVPRTLLGELLLQGSVAILEPGKDLVKRGGFDHGVILHHEASVSEEGFPTKDTAYRAQAVQAILHRRDDSANILGPHLHPFDASRQEVVRLNHPELILRDPGLKKSAMRKEFGAGDTDEHDGTVRVGGLRPFLEDGRLALLEVGVESLEELEVALDLSRQLALVLRRCGQGQPNGRNTQEERKGRTHCSVKDVEQGLASSRDDVVAERRRSTLCAGGGWRQRNSRNRLSEGSNTHVHDPAPVVRYSFSACC